MDRILSIYSRQATLEDLPYISGYGGEFSSSIFQQAGPRRIPGISFHFFIVTITDHLSQTVKLRVFLITITIALDKTDEMH